jgi:hypothetical protein
MKVSATVFEFVSEKGENVGSDSITEDELRA